MVSEAALRLYKFRERCRQNQDKIKIQQQEAIRINRTRIDNWFRGLSQSELNKVPGYSPDFGQTAYYIGQYKTRNP